MTPLQLNTWATRHNVTHEALADLIALFTNVVTEPINVTTGKSEAAVQSEIRMEASRCGARLFRNQVGACKDETGRLVRFGLMNDSAPMNKIIKSPDLVGIRPVLITQSHVGTVIGQFLAREVKKADWTYKGDAHELAQLKALTLITGLGGDARFANRVGTI
jgi:hypothetical protein